jgi:hypothetical protein
MNAPRALPIVSGPVGLAETNSTLTLRGRIGATRPQVPGAARTASTVSSRTASDRWRLMNPGGAAAADAIGEPGSADAADSRSTIASAIASGGRRNGRASFIARLVARSPCSAFAGRSMSTPKAAPSGIAGSSPAATAAVHAASMASRTRARTVFVGPGGVALAPGGLGAVVMGGQCYRPGPPARSTGPLASGVLPELRDGLERVSSGSPDQSVTHGTGIDRHAMSGAVRMCVIGAGNRVFQLVLFLPAATYDPPASIRGTVTEGSASTGP